jgi:hypothetical protein
MGTKKGQRRKTARRAYEPKKKRKKPAWKVKEAAPAGLFWNRALRAGWRPAIRWKPIGIRWRLKK